MLEILGVIWNIERHIIGFIAVCQNFSCIIEGFSSIQNCEIISDVDSITNAMLQHAQLFTSDNLDIVGSQFVNRAFQDAIISLGARQEFTRYYTPEQNGHTESFHKTLKKEYL